MGTNTYDVEKLIRDETDEKAIIACIGPTGEKLARIAAIMNNAKHGRAAAKCGLGAVVGSKRLKA